VEPSNFIIPVYLRNKTTIEMAAMAETLAKKDPEVEQLEDSDDDMPTLTSEPVVVSTFLHTLLVINAYFIIQYFILFVFHSIKLTNLCILHDFIFHFTI
jgi:hypothetical protein